MIAGERLAVGATGQGLPDEVIALWCAIVTDPDVAREFEIDSRLALDLLCVVLFPGTAGPTTLN